MRLLRLELTAYGPFAGRELDLSLPGPGGLHLVTGPNEAGKSTALRAVRDLLFGIPENTRDAHRHPGPDLKLGATIERSGGETLTIVRRKKRKDPLRDSEDRPLPEAALLPYLSGLTRELFEAKFGLDHERLQSGGRALLAGKGQLGESLFDAGLGATPIHGLLERLHGEADKLFSPRAKNRPLNQAIASYQRARIDGKGAILLVDKWKNQREKLEALGHRLDEQRALQKALRLEEHRTRRALNVLKQIAKRDTLVSERAALGTLPRLPEGAEARRRELLLQREKAELDLGRLEREITVRERRLSELPVPEGLTRFDEGSIQRLRDQVGSVREAAVHLPKVEAALREREDRARASLRRLGKSEDLEQVERFRLDAARLARIERLAREGLLLDDKIAAAREQLQRADAEWAAQQQALEAVEVSEAALRLEPLVQQGRAQAELDRQILDAELELERLRSALRRGLGALGLEALPDPAPEVEDEDLAELERAFSALGERGRQLDKERDALEQRRSDLEREVRAITRAGEVPSEADLLAARARREQGWRSVRDAWGAGRPADAVDAAFDPDRPLGDAFERAVSRADELSDRLRREAQRVSDLAWRRAELEQLAEARERLERAAARRDAERVEIDQRWAEILARFGLTDRSVRQLRGWLARYRECLALAERVSDWGARHERWSQARARSLAELASELRALGVPIEPSAGLVQAVERAAQVVAEARDALQERKALARALTQLSARRREQQQELERLAAERQQWQDAWTDAIGVLELGTAAAPSEVAALLAELQDLFQCVDSFPSELRRIQGMRRNAEVFRAQVADLVREHAPDLASLEPAAAAEALVNRYHRARRNLEERERLEAELAERRAERLDAEALLQAAQGGLLALMERAGVESADALEQVEQRVARAHQIEAQLEELERELLDSGEGASIAALIEEARCIERSGTSPRVRLAEVAEELERVDAEINGLMTEMASVEAGLRLFQTEQRGADAAQQLSQLTAEIAEQVRRYARAKLAATLLEREVERYRERHQGPILQRASRLFVELTQERYRGLRAGLTEQLVCVRADGKELEVDDLSEGTQYQLFLALRLGTYELYLEHNEPMPLVLDDILIHFDDGRAKAALKVLAELAARAQILFFTHHEHLLGLAREVVSTPAYREHKLSLG